MKIKSGTEELIAKYLLGDITEHEKKQLDNWIKTSPQHEEFFNRLRTSASFRKRYEAYTQINSHQAWKYFKKKYCQVSVTSILLKYAAILILPIIITAGGWYFYTASEKQNTLIVPYGSHSSIVLADGSKVWINSGSKLRFPSSFGPGERRIKVEGEIYIEVAKDTSRPFYVETPQLTVNVLGTKFNVSAYADDALQSVVLVEGKVNVKANSNEDFVLLPNQRFKLSDGISGIDEVNAYDYISWKDGVLQFRGETMKDIIQRLSRYYNVSITCTPEVAQKCTMGKLILFDDIEQVMKTFSLLYDVQCTIEAGSIKIE